MKNFFKLILHANDESHVDVLNRTPAISFRVPPLFTLHKIYETWHENSIFFVKDDIGDVVKLNANVTYIGAFSAVAFYIPQWHGPASFHVYHEDGTDVDGNAEVVDQMIDIIRS